MKPQTQKWIEAARLLTKDHRAAVKCPECNLCCLTIKDEILSRGTAGMDRYLICTTCGKWNVLRSRQFRIE